MRVGSWGSPAGSAQGAVGVLASARERMRREGKEAGGKAVPLGEAPIRIVVCVTLEGRSNCSLCLAPHPVPLKRSQGRVSTLRLAVRLGRAQGRAA